MRTTMGLVTGLLLVVGASQGADALTRDDTMTAWRQASTGERMRLLDALRAANKKLLQASRPRVIECMNAAAAIQGHGDLQIGEVAEACSESPMPDGTTSTGI